MSILAALPVCTPQYKTIEKRVRELSTGPGNGTVGIIEVEITSDASGALAKTFTVPYDCKILEAIAICTSSNTLGTLQVRRSSTVISAAIICAVDTTIARSATLVAAEKNLLVGTTYNIVAGGTNATLTRGVVQLKVARA